MFSIIWPIEDLQIGQEITRDYAFGIEDENIRSCKLLPWIEDIEDEDYELTDKDPTIQEEPGIEYFIVKKYYNTKVFISIRLFCCYVN